MAVASVASWLAHPLLLLVVGAFLSSYLIPSFTRQWQSHQRELELKSSLIREINESTARYFGAIQLIELTGEEKSLTKLDEAYVRWRTSYDVVTSELETYFPGAPLLVRDWTNFGSGMIALYFLFKNVSSDARAATLESYREYLGAEPTSLPTIVSTPLLNAVDQIGAYDDELARLFDGFRFRKQDLIRGILRTRSAVHEPGGARLPRFPQSAAKVKDRT